MPTPVLPNTPSVTSLGIGTLIGIGPVVGTTTPTYVTIGQITDAKFSGASATVIKFSTLDGGVGVQKRRGSIDYGTVDLTYERKPGVGDAGQAAAKAAFNDPTGNPYMFNAVLYIAAGQTTAGDSATFQGVISKFTELSEISTDKLIEGMITIELSAPVVVTAGS
jgi:hypothetical protein